MSPKLLCRYTTSLPRYHGEGGPRKRWKGHKTDMDLAAPFLRQGGYFFFTARM